MMTITEAYQADDFCKAVMSLEEYRVWMLEIAAFEVAQFGEHHALTDEALDFLDWPMTGREIRALVRDGHLIREEIWQAIGDKASRIRQPHLYNDQVGGVAVAEAQLKG